MTGQSFHSRIMSPFGLEADLRGIGVNAIWMATLDEADAGVRRRVVRKP